MARVTSTIVVASSNANKIRELQTVAQRFGLELLSPAEVASSVDEPYVDETEPTYRGNASLKARAYSRWANLPALGDDSGLEVMALGGRPGIHSARYAGASTPHAQKMQFLLSELRDAQQADPSLNRDAVFRCSLVLCYPDGHEMYSESSLAGRILESPQGDLGFGYDPIVFITSLGKTLAELDFDETCRVGFRARAAERLFRMLADDAVG